MKNYYFPLLVLMINVFLPQNLSAQAPIIQAVTPKSTMVEQNGKFEASLTMVAAFSNPYDYDEIRVQVLFTAPNGQQTNVEGFYMEGFDINNATGNLMPVVAQNGFRIRFAPREVGLWSYVVTCTNGTGTGAFPAQTFQCTPVAAPQNKGFVLANNSNYLSFENGDQYIPVGENIAWPSTNAYLDYKKWVGKMADNGGNFFRLWLCAWGLGMEWENNNNGYAGLKKYKQSSACYLDWLFDYCAEKGVYVQFCLNHHGQVSSQVNPNWNDSPYNAANGGPCQNTWDFFSNAQAKALMKNRLRYTLARWGCQRSIMTWELFNEVNWTDNYDQHRPEIADWHAEMAAFLKQKDFVARPVSTSYGTPQSEDPAVWNNPDMDYTQRHYYFDSPNLEAILSAGIQENLQQYDKPAHIGEFGLGVTNIGLGTLDPAGIHIHNNLWGPLFGGSMGSGMTWWWDSYIEPSNLYHHFAAVSAVAGQVPLQQADFRPTTAVVSGAPGDLKINTSLGWAGLGDSLIQVGSDGTVVPANYKLAEYLYGVQWNTQYRRPPSFKVDLLQAGQFKVLVGAALATSPNLTIWVDGVQKLSVSPTANQTYAVNVPAGQHTIKVDNLGTDWMQISGFAVSGIGSAISAYVLQSADKKRLAGWILNNNYNHAYVKTNGAPDALSGAVLSVNNMANGSYVAKWYDCQTGTMIGTDPITVSAGTLVLPLPDLTWDVALVLDELPVSTAEIAAAMPISVFPNPIKDAAVNISFSLQHAENVRIALCDAGGSVVQSLHDGPLIQGEQNIAAQVSDALPSGIYWVRVEAGQAKSAKAVGVVR